MQTNRQIQQAVLEIQVKMADMQEGLPLSYSEWLAVLRELIRSLENWPAIIEK